MQYIALEQLESVYKSCNLVSNICLYASGEARQPVAVVHPHEVHLRAALPAGVDGNGSLVDLCENKKVVELVLKECNAVGTKNGLKSMEKLEGVVLTAEEWTPENGFVTAAQKVQRVRVARHFEEQIKVRVSGRDLFGGFGMTSPWSLAYVRPLDVCLR